MHLTFDEIIDILDQNYITTKRMGFSLNPNIYEVPNLNTILIYISPDNVKVSVTIDDVRTKSNVYNFQTLILTQKSFLYNLSSTRSHSYPLEDLF